MRLSLRAYVLMREEYPLAMPYLEKGDTEEPRTYLFNGPVLNFKGVGRFVMGLADEITILSPTEFKSYVKDKIKKQKLV
jgi:predicted DNA-binding transcriptional regulator YafY